MKRRKIRYKRIFLSLLFLAIILAATGAGARYIFNHFYVRGGLPAKSEAQYCLFMGKRAESPAQADSLLLTVYDPQARTFCALSLPGNTLLVRNEEELLLKDVYADGGAERTVSAVENLMHIRIGKYAVVDETAFADIVNRFGGLDFYVEQDMRHEDAGGQEDIRLRKGVQRLDGDGAVSYMRYLESNDGEIGRLQRGERFFKAGLRVLRGNFRPYVWWIVRENWTLPDTNLSNQEAASLAYDVIGLPEENIHFLVLPGETKKIHNTAVWQVNPVEIQRAVGLLLNAGGTEKEK